MLFVCLNNNNNDNNNKYITYKNKNGCFYIVLINPLFVRLQAF